MEEKDGLKKQIDKAKKMGPILKNVKVVIHYQGKKHFQDEKPKPEHIYLGKPVYLLGQGGGPEYHRKVGVVALNIDEAENKILNYCIELNPGTRKRMWDVIGLKRQEEVKRVSLEDTVRVLQNAGIPFVDPK